MRQQLAVTCIAVALALAVGVAPTTTATQAGSHSQKRTPSALTTVQAYFQVLNSGMKSGDFSHLSSVYAATATLTKSGTDGTTAVYHGLSEIEGYYKGLYAKVGGWQWTTDEMRPLSKQIILAYEHAGSPPLAVASRCMHVFTVKKGKITSYDWTAFFPGQK